jgi:MFS family permease
VWNIQYMRPDSHSALQVNSAFNITWVCPSRFLTSSSFTDHAQGCFALVAGRMGDIYGLRSAYLLGITFCTVWIAISGFMPVRTAPFE